VFLSSILEKFSAGFRQGISFLTQILFPKKSRLVSSLVFFAKYIVSLPL